MLAMLVFLIVAAAAAGGGVVVRAAAGGGVEARSVPDGWGPPAARLRRGSAPPLVLVPGLSKKEATTEPAPVGRMTMV